MRKILGKNFFNRPALIVAKDLLGKLLVRKVQNGETKSLMITEVEAYDGLRDKASHAHKGKTARNKIMFERGGYWYVYFVYGMHFMLNIVTGEKDYPAAILIRGAGDINGPGKLTKFFEIDKKFNEKLAARETGLWIEDRGIKIRAGNIERTPRIGVNYAGPVWSKKPYRFLIK